MITRQITEDWYNRVVVNSYLLAVDECICTVQAVSDDGEVLKQESFLVFANSPKDGYPEHLVIGLTEEELKELGYETTTE
jgi:hypothetical protein